MTDWIPEMHVAPNQPDGWIVMHENDSGVTKILLWPDDPQGAAADTIPEDFHVLEVLSVGVDLTTVAGGGNRRISLQQKGADGTILSTWYSQSVQAGGLSGGRYDFTLGLAYAAPIVGTSPATSRESMPLFVLQPGHDFTVALLNSQAGDDFKVQIRGRVLVRP